MVRKLSITLEDYLFRGLHRVVGRGRISRFIEELVRPHVINSELRRGYRRMAEDEGRERSALEWAEATIGEPGDQTR